MEIGAITSENISEILRGLSRSRQTGVLLLENESVQERIFFALGKIVEIQRGEDPPVMKFIERLNHAGYKISADAQPFPSYTELYAHLSRPGKGTNSIDEESLKRAIEQRIIDEFFTLRLITGGSYVFEAGGFEYDREFCPSISVASLLLDLVTLEKVEQEFPEIFEDALIFKSGTASPDSLTDEQKILYNLIGGETSAEELYKKSLLSWLHVRSALLEMRAEGHIQCSKTSQPEGETAQNDISELDISSTENKSVQSTEKNVEVRDVADPLRTGNSDPLVEEGIIEEGEEELPELSLKDAMKENQSKTPPPLEQPSSSEAQEVVMRKSKSKSRKKSKKVSKKKAQPEKAGLATRVGAYGETLLYEKWPYYTFGLVFLVASLVIPLLMWKDTLILQF